MVSEIAQFHVALSQLYIQGAHNTVHTLIALGQELFEAVEAQRPAPSPQEEELSRAFELAFDPHPHIIE